MRSTAFRIARGRLAALAVAASLAAPAAAEGGPHLDFDRDGPSAPYQERGSADRCQFFRGEAYQRSLGDFAGDMLLACEEIARRVAAGVPLGDRLEAFGAMLDDYRSAVIVAGDEAFARRRRAGRAPWELGLSEAEKYAIADATGALLALDAIRGGF